MGRMCRMDKRGGLPRLGPGRGSLGRVLMVGGMGLLLGLMAAPGCGQERDPNRPLSADEGAELLREVRSDRRRLSDLTPAEKQYLLQTLKR